MEFVLVVGISMLALYLSARLAACQDSAEMWQRRARSAERELAQFYDAQDDEAGVH